MYSHTGFPCRSSKVTWYWTLFLPLTLHPCKLSYSSASVNTSQFLRATSLTKITKNHNYFVRENTPKLAKFHNSPAPDNTSWTCDLVISNKSQKIKGDLRNQNQRISIAVCKYQNIHVQIMVKFWIIWLMYVRLSVRCGLWLELKFSVNENTWRGSEPICQQWILFLMS